MSGELSILAFTALSIGFFHTILGPDHYIPFIAMAKAGKWSTRKTIVVTVLSGIGHVFGSIVLGFIGVGIGVALNILEDIEAIRGDLASWLLISFGLAYMLWGIRRVVKNKKHTHWHKHDAGIIHDHEHSHHKEHSHVHTKENAANLTPWILFAIFVFGPCEALIPILMYPAANIGVSGLVVVTAIFSVTTILTMLSIVVISIYGINVLPLNKFEKYSHAMAGAIILISGISVQFLGM
jgi:ABC-type nickel/cobalt efflux system permease component RcnA